MKKPLKKKEGKKIGLWEISFGTDQRKKWLVYGVEKPKIRKVRMPISNGAKISTMFFDEVIPAPTRK